MSFKQFIKSCFLFFSKPIPLAVLGLILMIVPSIVVSSFGIDLESGIEPGFSLGVFYGIGFVLSCYGLFKFYRSSKPESSYVDPEEEFFKSQALINKKILLILEDQWNDVLTVSDPDDPCV